MATPASEALRLGGDLAFGAGGMPTDFIIGAFVKSVAFANGVWTVTFQDAAGLEMNAVLGVEVKLHATRASYNAASATDGVLHIVTAA